MAFNYRLDPETRTMLIESSVRNCDLESLRKCIQQSNEAIFVAEEDEELVGCYCLMVLFTDKDT